MRGVRALVSSPRPTDIAKHRDRLHHPPFAFQPAAQHAGLANVPALIDVGLPFVLHAVAIKIYERQAAERRGSAIDQPAIIAQEVGRRAAEPAMAKLHACLPGAVFLGSQRRIRNFEVGSAIPQKSFVVQVGSSKSLREPQQEPGMRARPDGEKRAAREIVKVIVEAHRPGAGIGQHALNRRFGEPPANIESYRPDHPEFVLQEQRLRAILAAVGRAPRARPGHAGRPVEILPRTRNIVIVQIEAVGQRMPRPQVGAHLRGYASRVRTVEVFRAHIGGCRGHRV